MAVLETPSGKQIDVEIDYDDESGALLLVAGPVEYVLRIDVLGEAAALLGEVEQLVRDLDPG